MPHVLFDPNSIDWEQIILAQIGSGFYFEGLPYQRGAGIGTIFGHILRYLIPIGKIIGKEIGMEGLRSGERIVQDILSGNPVKKSVLVETQQGLKNAVDNIYARGEDMFAKQKGEGRRRKGRVAHSRIGPNLSTVNKPKQRKKTNSRDKKISHYLSY